MFNTLLYQQTPEGIQNASASMGFASSQGLAPVVVIVLLAAVGIAIARPLVPRLAQAKIFGKVGSAVTTSMAYAVWGLASVAVAGLLAAPVYAVMTVDSGTRSELLRWLGIGVVGYVALMVLGWGAKNVVEAYIDAHPDLESLDELLPDAPESGDEVATDGGQRGTGDD